MFEIELIICKKMDSALNNLRRLIYNKNQTTNQPILLLRWYENIQHENFCDELISTWNIDQLQLLRDGERDSHLSVVA